MSDVRRFDLLERVVRDERRRLDDSVSTILARLSAHTHPASGIQVVTSTGDVTSPVTGQIIFNTTDMLLYRYTGSAWVAFLALGGTTAATRHEARYEQTSSMSIPNVTDTKLRFQTAAYTSDDVTPSLIGNQNFLLNRGGLWRISTGVRYNGAAGASERHIFAQTGTSFAIANRFMSTAITVDDIADAPVTVSGSTEIRVAAGTSVIVGAFQNSGGSVSTDVAFGGTAHLALTWLRP